jgi:hypothetical protein
LLIIAFVFQLSMLRDYGVDPFSQSKSYPTSAQQVSIANSVNLAKSRV